MKRSLSQGPIGAELQDMINEVVRNTGPAQPGNNPSTSINGNNEVTSEDMERVCKIYEGHPRTANPAPTPPGPGVEAHNPLHHLQYQTAKRFREPAHPQVPPRLSEAYFHRCQP